MPDLYCQSCKQTRPHKSVMRRNLTEPPSLKQQLAELIGRIATGKHYYKMEQQHFCRVCNCQNVAIEPSQAAQSINNPSHVGVH